jgi:kumamolisin
VADYTRRNRLPEVSSNTAQRTVVLRGTAKPLTGVYPTELKQYDSPAGRFRGRPGAVQVPEELSAIVEGVFGF